MTQAGKKLQSILVAVIAVFAVTLAISALTAQPVYAKDYVDGNGIKYSLDNRQATVTGYDIALSGDVEIPSTITYDGEAYIVNAIGNEAFNKCISLTSITIPNSVTSIGDSAFRICISLTSVEIPNSVTRIGNNAFNSCSSLTSITIPDGVTSIRIGAFEYCSSLTSVTIPDSVTSIGTDAFEGCSSLTSITIPKNVTSIENDLFYLCSSLESITIPDGVTIIKESAFRSCSSLSNVTIPDSVTSIGNNAFEGCQIINMHYNGSKTQWKDVTTGDGWDASWPTSYNTCDVTITSGDNMNASSMEDLTQVVTYGSEMTSVVFTAVDGYYFPADYPVDTVNGVSVIRDSDSQITVSGTPTGDVEITLPAATIKPAPTPDPYTTVPATEENAIAIRALIKDGVASVADISVSEINQAASGNTAIIDLSKVTVDGKTVEIREKELTKSTINNFLSSDATGLEVRLSTGTAVVDKTSLGAIASEAAGGTVSLYIATSTDAEKTMNEAQKAVIEGMEGALAIEAKLTSGGKAISAPLTIRVPFETEKLVRAWYVAEDGSKEATECTHDGKVAELTLTHCSHYVLEAYELLENTLSVKGKTVTVKYSKLKEKAQTLKASKLYKFTNKGKGTKTYTLSSAKKAKKSFKKYFTVDKKTGKIKVKKGLKKGTYTVKVKVKAAGIDDYMPATKTVTIKIRVK